jgi:hypothetical protein
MKRNIKGESGWPELLRSDECHKVLAQVWNLGLAVRASSIDLIL